jgi:hypothetical protein
MLNIQNWNQYIDIWAKFSSLVEIVIFNYAYIQLCFCSYWYLCNFINFTGIRKIYLCNHRMMPIYLCVYAFIIPSSFYKITYLQHIKLNDKLFCVGRVMEIWDPHVLSKYKGEDTYTLGHCSNIAPLLGLLDPPSNDTINGVLGGYAKAYLMYILFMSLVDDVV